MTWGRSDVATTDLIIVSTRAPGYICPDVWADDGVQANLINQADTAWQYSFYTIIPDGITWGQTTNTAKYPYIVDTGTTMMYLPPRKPPRPSKLGTRLV